jgi:outer membrane receptor protein involved in Fe transport
MHINGLRASTALTSAVFAFGLLYAGQASAQTAATDSQTLCPDGSTPTANAPCPPSATAPAASDQSGEIVVTGSRIRRPNLDSPVPVTSISGEDFFKTGSTSVGDVLNELPALTSTFSQSNSTRFLGTSGLSLLDLRGLGTQRTLVLVNGRRHVAGDILNEASSPDINTIPTDLIERVDVVTGGDSAVYGSDAVAGVVNFVLKDHYDGVQLRAQSGISQYGDAPSSFASALFGKNFAGGRGNIAVNLEYAHQGAFYASDRKDYSINSGFVTVDDVVNDGKPNRVFMHDIRSATYSNGGTFLTCGDPTCVNSYYGSYHFTPDGTLIPTTGNRVGLFAGGNFIGGNGDNFRDGTQLGLLPNQDRYSANLIGHFEISKAFVPFIEAKYVRSDILGSASGPFFFNGGSTGDPRERFYTDNPYLSAQARTFLNDYYGAAPGDHQPFYFNENATSLTNRQERIRRETYRIVAGVRGEIADGWSYELSGNYGEFKEKNEILGNVNEQRFILAIDAVDEGTFNTGVANGHIVCRATVDPAARIALSNPYVDPAFAQAHLAADVAACQPINLFGAGNVSDAAKNYILQNSVANGRISQLVFNGFLSGDTRNFLNLPGGPIGIALGAEYRRETASYRQDDYTKAAMTFYNAIPDLSAPAFEVKEVFGELRLPILKDVPFFHELTLSGAARFASYKGDAGSVWAYNGNLEWSPVRDIRFRANYSRAVRAPTIVDLYSGFGQNYEFISDPCSNYGANPGTTVAKNCAAAGVPSNFVYNYIQTLAYESGGNSKLKVETSDSYTIGTVITPRWVPGLSLTVDWFDINVNNAIASLDAQSVIDACYDQVSGINNQFCGLFQRNSGPGNGPAGEQPGRIIEGSLHVIPLNYAKLRVRGIDIELGYQHAIADLVNVSTRLIYTHNFRNDTYLDALDPKDRTQQLGTLGFPFDEFSFNLDLNKGPVTLGYKLRYVGKMTVAPWAALHSVNGQAPQETDYSDIKYYPDTYLHNVRLQFDATKKFNFYVGVDNVFDTKPPLGTTGAGFGSAIYDNVGRFFYAGIVAKF